MHYDLRFFLFMEREMDDSGSDGCSAVEDVDDAGKKMKALTSWSSSSSVPSPLLCVNPFCPARERERGFCMSGAKNTFVGMT